MSSFEWMELHSVSLEIRASRARLAEARSAKDRRLARSLEKDIATAEDRRARLLAHLTAEVAGAAERVRHGDLSEGEAGTTLESIEDDTLVLGAAEAEAAAEAVEAQALAEAAAVAEAAEAEADTAEREPTADEAETPPAEPRQEPPEETVVGFTTAAFISDTDRREGENVVWDQLTPTDIDRAKRELGVRRAEILARHAEELKSLDADQTELETLEAAIAAFARKFKASAAVVALDGERETRARA